MYFVQTTVRSHACEVEAYGKPGGCSHICLLSGSYKSRTCRCRAGYSLDGDGQSCKSQYQSTLYTVQHCANVNKSKKELFFFFFKYVFFFVLSKTFLNKVKILGKR